MLFKIVDLRISFQINLNSDQILLNNNIFVRPWGHNPQVLSTKPNQAVFFLFVF